MNFELLASTLDTLLPAGVTPNLIGHHGIGKTEFMRQYAAQRGYKLLEFRLGTCSDAGDLVGIPHIKEVDDIKSLVTLFATPDFFPREGKFILFFDEWNRCQVKEIYQALFNLILERKMNQYHMPAESRVVLACNPSGTDDYDVFEFDDAAFRDRLCHLKVQPTAKEYLDFNKKKHPNSQVSDFIASYPEMRASKLEEFKLPEPKYSGRTWSRLMEIEKLNPSDEVMKTIMLGTVGIHATNLYLKFKEAEVVMKGKDILKDFPKFKPHVEKLTQHNKLDIINHLADDVISELNALDEKDKRMTEKQENNLVEFILALPKDFSYPFLKEKLRYIRAIYPKNMDGETEYFVAKDKRFLEHFKKYKKKAS